MTEGSPRAVTFWSRDSQLIVDNAARSVFVDGNEVSLTPTEFDILAFLCTRAGTVVPTPELIEAVWGSWYGPVDHVFVHIHHIRRKLGACGKLIVTKRKAGYLLRVERRETPPPPPWPQITRDYADLLHEDALQRGSIWLLVDRDRRVSWVSDSLTHHLGWVPGQLVGKPPWTLALEGEEGKFRRNVPLPGEPTMVRFETEVVNAQGSPVGIQVYCQMIVDADGNRVGGIGEWVVGGPVGAPPLDGIAGHQRMPFRLHYDGDHVLTAVEPHQPFIGWNPDDVIGTYFSLAGLDRETTARAMEALLALGRDHQISRTPVMRSDGTPAIVDIRLCLTMEDGVLMGYTGDVRVLD